MYRRVHFWELHSRVETARDKGYARSLPCKGKGARWHLFRDRDCSNPVSFYFSARDPEKGRLFVWETHRCRKCEPCVTAHARSWWARGHQEYGRSYSTWFVTLTGRPEFHDEIDRRCGDAKAEFWAMSETDKTKHRIRQFKMEGQRWLHRVRERAKRRGQDVRSNLRYMLVAELHPGKKGTSAVTGKPHLHVLVHERVPGAVIQPTEYHVSPDGLVWASEESMIRQAWTAGFSRAERCSDAYAALYICKYLWKDHTQTSRLQASKWYGVKQV